MVPYNHVAYTTRINPPGATPTLTLSSIWPLLHRKIHHGEEFVGGAILRTEVLSTTTTATGHTLITREVIFRASPDGSRPQRTLKEECLVHEPAKVEFTMEDGSKAQNIVSVGSDGELYMTYTFDWAHPELEGDEEGLRAAEEKEKKMAEVAVESTLKVMRNILSK